MMVQTSLMRRGRTRLCGEVEEWDCYRNGFMGGVVFRSSERHVVAISVSD